MELIHKIIFATVFLAVVVTGNPKIGKRLQQHFLLRADEAEPQSVIVSFSKPISTVIDKINMLRFEDMAIKRTVLKEAQIEFTTEAQREVQVALELAGIKYESFWITNKMHIPEADYKTVELVTEFPSVASIEIASTAYLTLPVNGNAENIAANTSSLTKRAGVTWGIERIRAQQVWQNYTGRGIVVANIDSGVRFTHQALKSNWRSQYGWYDPFQGTATPNDHGGHGTHVMGTIAGKNGIGVAPDATWIACKGCSSSECSEPALIACGQWIFCPTLPNGASRNCAMAPNVVANSWGQPSGHNDAFYDEIISSWHAAGIIPVFAIANSGPHCGTVGSPASQPNNIAVGNMEMHDRINSNSELETASSRAPNKANQIRPDIAAPGTNVESAGHQADNQYVPLTGSSMACPHVAGVIALMLQKNPELKYKQVYKAITSTAVTSTLDLSGAQTCGGIPPNKFPNCVFGYGRIDSLNAVSAI